MQAIGDKRINIQKGISKKGINSLVGKCQKYAVSQRKYITKQLQNVWKREVEILEEKLSEKTEENQKVEVLEIDERYTYIKKTKK